MTLKEQLMQEIESMPEELLAEVLNFASSIQVKREKPQAFAELPAKLTYRPASGRSILRHAGTWQGDDFEECLQMVYDTRSPAKFDEQSF